MRSDPGASVVHFCIARQPHRRGVSAAVGHRGMEAKIIGGVVPQLSFFDSSRENGPMAHISGLRYSTRLRTQLEPSVRPHAMFR